MRLDQFISQATYYSRSQSQILIRQGRVLVDGQVVRSAKTKIDVTQPIQLDDQLLTLTHSVYLMLNKPMGYVSATVDDQFSTVLDLIDHPAKKDLHPVGRLDKDTTGLLLLTNDGQWSHRLTSPKHHVSKVYIADLVEAVKDEQLQPLRDGILLRNEDKPTLPAKLHLVTETQVQIEITEGRYHQVKRMFAAIGNRVTQLQRAKVGSVCLDQDLGLGEWRELTQKEQLEVFV